MKGYRFLNLCEVLRKGDEYRTITGWLKTSCDGQPVEHTGTYRRKIEAPLRAVKTLSRSLLITRADAEKLFTLAKRHCKHEIGQDTRDADEWRTCLKRIKALEKATLNPK